MIRVLFIDDNPLDQDTVAMILGDRYSVLAAESADEGLRVLRDQDPDVVLLDIDLPDRDGLSLLEDILASPSAPPVIMLTAYGEVDFVKRAMQAGAYDFVLKGPCLKSLDGALQRAVQNADARRLFLAGPPPDGFAGMVGESPPVRELKTLIARYAPSDAPVLILGESGSGKELCAAALHRLSPRREGPLVTVNCGAIPVSLLESELFGAERGAFTDAVSRPGFFERANRGTIFLDEIGELAVAAQAALLRVLESQELIRVGGTEAVRLNVRVVAATNQDLRRRLEQKLFREDLYYRINVLPLRVPPLRERPGDVPLLAAHILAGRGKPAPSLRPEALERLCAYSWPGNVRELRNVLERAAVICEDGVIRARDLVW
jgi:DNA-binding NtrC family response regulator